MIRLLRVYKSGTKTMTVNGHDQRQDVSNDPKKTAANITGLVELPPKRQNQQAAAMARDVSRLEP